MGCMPFMIYISHINYVEHFSWFQCVLQYLVSPEQGKITDDTIEVFLHAKLLKKYDYRKKNFHLICAS